MSFLVSALKSTIIRKSGYTKFKEIKIPTYSGARWNGWVIHLSGAFDNYEGTAAPKRDKKLLIVPSDNYGGMDRPYHEIQDIVLRWYDHWLKASHYELDEGKSKPYAPYHPHRRSLPIKPGEITLYASDTRMTSNVFLAGHRIRLEISGQDQVHALWYHVPHVAEVKHRIYGTGDQPSYLLLRRTEY